MTVDDLTRTLLGMLREHHASEPKESDYPDDIGHAQQAYWADYNKWAAVDFGMSLAVGARLTKLALDDLDDGP
jgi:hypothetical protein